MVKDPICGMNVDEKEAKKKGLVVDKKGKTNYFCSASCKGKFLGKKEPWYQSKAFGKAFPWVLGIVLIGLAVWSYFGGFMIKYMGWFFIVFSIMKMLDWKGFVNAYSMYDIIAKRVEFYGWIYPGIEFVLGVMYLTGLYHYRGMGNFVCNGYRGHWSWNKTIEEREIPVCLFGYKNQCAFD